MEVRRFLSVAASGQTCQTCFNSNPTHWPACLLPFPDSDFHNASSRASDFKISAWARDRRDFFAASSRATTRYSTYSIPTNQREARNSVGAKAAYLVAPKQCIAFFTPSSAPIGKQLLKASQVSTSDTPAALRQNQIRLYTSIPHSRTWLAFFLASGHSSAVPRALYIAVRRRTAIIAGIAYRSPIVLSSEGCNHRVFAKL